MDGNGSLEGEMKAWREWKNGGRDVSWKKMKSSRGWKHGGRDGSNMEGMEVTWRGWKNGGSGSIEVNGIIEGDGRLERGVEEWRRRVFREE